jgi:hypothetical protein
MATQLLNSTHPMKTAALTLTFILLLNLAGLAENALFIGNSYTIGSRSDPIASAGGVPKYVEDIAASKGKALKSETVAVRSKDLAHHLEQPATQEAIQAAAWDWVVLQELSTKPTRVGDPEGFFDDAMTFYQRARASSPNAKILFYQTWPRPPDSSYINTTGKPSAKKFESSEEMLRQVVDNYAEAARRVEGAEPGRQVFVARVGEAFAQASAKYPHLAVYGKDSHHASPEGYYLASLVIYGTLFSDSPIGASHELPGLSIDADAARSLQEIAAEVVAETPTYEAAASGEE